MTNHSDLIVGFSFSLRPDGSAGSYNALLAEHLLGQIQKHEAAFGEIPYVAVQWEIADALFALSSQWFKKLESEKKVFVVEPPKFTDDDIDAAGLQLFFESKIPLASQSDTRRTYDVRLVERFSASVADRSIRQGLNDLLRQSRFYEYFKGLELFDLTRPALGAFFTEFRQLPLSKDYPQGLNGYHRIRVNRLIIERIIDNPKLLKSGQYLSTAGVIDAVFEHCYSQNLALKDISVIAHPLHAPRCIEQARSFFAARDQAPRVQCEFLDATFPWDPSSAQVWCRSLSNWQVYEKVVRTLLANNRSA
ncbi:MAG: hypothetical protein P8N51_14670 [Pseudomonadales bacterium]|nr:hypothetical protein [Pseudomonadales bacterium]MDG1441885.1 hypothetical protein [Pseudomonadales bacterium]